MDALAARRRNLGDDHPDTLETINGLGLLHREQQRYQETYDALSSILGLGMASMIQCRPNRHQI